MGTKDMKYRVTIVIGWLGMALLQIMMQITDMMEAFLNNDNSFVLHYHMKGIWIVAILIVVNIIAQLTTMIANNVTAKKVIFGFSIFYTLYLVVHQVLHLVQGDGFDIHFIFDLMHHACGIVAIVNAYKWMKLGTSK